MKGVIILATGNSVARLPLPRHQLKKDKPQWRMIVNRFV